MPPHRQLRRLTGFACAAIVLLSLRLATASPVAEPGPPRISTIRCEILVPSARLPSPQEGRLIVIFARTNSPEPRLLLGNAGLGAPAALSQDTRLAPSTNAIVMAGSPILFPAPAPLPAGEYYLQALFDLNRDLRLPNAPGNLYSQPQKVRLAGNGKDLVCLALDQAVPAEQPPPNTENVHYLKLQSRLLTAFHGRPIFLRAGIILPRDYGREPARKYPLWICIGGFGTRYTVVEHMARDPGFTSVWQDNRTPRFILLHLDGAGPLGDPYYVNSANNGPFGDALVKELIPEVESRFRAVGTPRTRVLSGASTGGWISLALQTFYPDFFNGTWSSSPDPVDFRAYELINIYEDDNAYVNHFGNERPSQRTLSGDVVLTVRQEVSMENLLGRHDSYVFSGQQWGAWNAVFSPRGPDGLPVPLWNPQTGVLDRRVAEQWKRYDLRLYLQEHWTSLAPKLRGKLHIGVGEADDYFLNNAVHLLNDFLAQAQPPFEGKIVFGPGKGHTWFYLSLPEMLRDMQAAIGKTD